MSAGRGAARPPARGGEGSGLDFGGTRAWLALGGSRPVLVVSQAQHLRAAFEPVARRHGYGRPIDTDRGRIAYRLGLEARPGAILCDTRLVDGGDAQVRAAVRSDFLLRETPLIVAPLAERAQGEAAASRLAEALFEALDAVLSPRGALLDDLASGAAQAAGWVEPIGVANLLRALAAAGCAGTLMLEPEQGPAVAVGLAAGLVVRVEDSGVPVEDLGLALVDLVGRRWRSFSFTRDGGAQAARPLRRAEAVETAIDLALQQNNALVHSIFERGLGQDGLAVDDRALLGWVARQPPEGRVLAEQVADGLVPSALDYGKHPALLRTLLHELRREAVLRVRSAALVGPGAGRAAPTGSQGPLLGVRPSSRATGRRSRVGRALIVAAACGGTLLVAAGGYFLLGR
ncbi:MAG: hypothetical protein IPL40_00380 [Proteobacteria bacterium]|nr:hypothetical protein [Pseudomonadota bacterium]